MRRLVLAAVMSTIVSVLLCAGIAAALARHYHEKTLADFRAALQEVKRDEIDRGKLAACTSVMNNSCTMLWGAPCVSKKPGKARWE